MESNYEEFKKTAFVNIDDYRKTVSGNGGFEYSQQIDDLIRFSNKVNSNLLIYMFGKKIGNHLAEKFVYECRRDLLLFLNKIDSEMRFFILHQIKTNDTLYAHC